MFSALIGVVVSLASWAFLELIHALQQWVYTDLPSALGFDTAPLVVAAARCSASPASIIAFAIERLPGTRGPRSPPRA